ncbi:unnamed protein product, partial [Mesorhabditis belari]|uniref:Acyltransferase C-terminal domain-containing protein n=1 Tax=Mesorhabditis belari TaxID=2138241 RepID=A0AAF3FIA5_9BILA
MGDFPLNDPSIAIHYDVIPVKPEWANEEKLQEFLYERYRRKDELLNEFYKTGQFPGESRGTVQVNGWLMLRAQVFWMGSYYLHHILWIKPLWTFVVACLYSMIF